MVLPVFLINRALQLSSCVALYSVNILCILEHISWCHLLSLATNNSSWLIQVFFVILDILYLLGHGSLIRFALIFSDCLEHKFFLSHKLFCCLLISILCLSLILSEPLVFLFGFFYYLVFSNHYYFYFHVDLSYL